MATEIERKFLLNNDDWRDSVEETHRIRQGYLAGTDKSSIRVRVADDRGELNIKSMTLGIERLEYEYAISRDDAEEMLDRLAIGPLIEKHRHLVRLGNHTWEIDEFFGDNDGLVVAEIELGSADEVFERPGWVGTEVSDDERYYNVMLAKHPFRNW